jgi:hypothetical protein
MRLIVALATLVLSAGSQAAAADAPLFDGHIHYSRPDWSVHTPDQIVAILWAHAGKSSGAAAVGALMDKHANLCADISCRYGDVASGGTLDPAWRALLIRHADRFMLGSDTWTTSRWEQVADMAAEARRFLQQLPPDVAAKIAYRNIEKLFP